jgi:hypothetical protein
LDEIDRKIINDTSTYLQRNSETADALKLLSWQEEGMQMPPPPERLPEDVEQALSLLETRSFVLQVTLEDGSARRTARRLPQALQLLRLREVPRPAVPPVNAAVRDATSSPGRLRAARAFFVSCPRRIASFCALTTPAGQVMQRWYQTSKRRTVAANGCTTP